MPERQHLYCGSGDGVNDARDTDTDDVDDGEAPAERDCVCEGDAVGVEHGRCAVVVGIDRRQCRPAADDVDFHAVQREPVGIDNNVFGLGLGLGLGPRP